MIVGDPFRGRAHCDSESFRNRPAEFLHDLTDHLHVHVTSGRHLGLPPTLTTWPLMSAKLVLRRRRAFSAHGRPHCVAEPAVWVRQRHRRGPRPLALVACMSLLMLGAHIATLECKSLGFVSQH